MSSETAIACINLGKAYAIYKRPEDRLKQMLWSLAWRGKKQYYDIFWALQNVSLEIKRGESVGIIGRNGSGKSTFLQMVCGTLTPTTGSAQVFGRVAALLELGAGFNPEFTGRENVYLAVSILGLSSEEIDERYEKIAAFAGIGDFINQPVKLYSSGMYARLAFAVAAHVDADVLIIDEILAVGDAAFTQKCMRFIHGFRERGTLLFVSHDTSSVVTLCDRAMWLDGGELRSLGSAKEVAYEYLASIFAEQDTSGSFKIGGTRRNQESEFRAAMKDFRAETLSNSNLCNKLEVFDFDPTAACFGDGGGAITAVRLRSGDGSLISSAEGGQVIELEVTTKAHKDLARPIVGFYLKDRLGQNLFGDNTYISYQQAPVPVVAGGLLTARFRFQLPYLPAGDYAFTVAFAEGTQLDHQQLHWIDEALFIAVHSSHVPRGLIGLPMINIELTADDDIADSNPTRRNAEC